MIKITDEETGRSSRVPLSMRGFSREEMTAYPGKLAAKLNTRRVFHVVNYDKL